MSLEETASALRYGQSLSDREFRILVLISDGHRSLESLSRRAGLSEKAIDAVIDDLMGRGIIGHDADGWPIHSPEERRGRDGEC